MTLLLVAVGVLLVSGSVALVLPRHAGTLASRLGAGGVIAAALLGLFPATAAVLGGTPAEASFAWGAFGTLRLGLDALSGFFLLPILALSALAALFGVEYMAAQAAHRHLGVAAFLFNGLVASMVLVVLARDALGFLLAWELMALTSFFLVAFESGKGSVREAGWLYLIASHLGTAFVFGFFLVLGGKAGALDFAALQAAGDAWPAAAGLLFVLALVGFGTKAGFLPLHVWLPEAHPAAPSHVSALMSGVMIKTGIYGLLRALTLLGPPPAWWGWTLVAVGVTSGVLGVLFALAQHDLKRLLAYHSVENIGIIALGLGLGLVGVAHDLPALAVLGFAGGLLHVINHAVFKGLLFLGAGAVVHATHTRDMDHLGGLARHMPWTAAGFLVGAVAIAGLPPLNGFISELLIYLGAFGAFASHSTAVVVPALVTLLGLALIGGLAAACFTKAFGAVFLGEPRSAHVSQARDPGPLMRLPMAALALLCLLIGLAAPLLVGAMAPVIAAVSGLAPESAAAELAVAAHTLWQVLLVTVLLIVVIAALAWARARLLSARTVTQAVTWDCGYARPAASMQYTASSFAAPLVRLFHPFLATRRTLRAPQGYFPAGAALATDTPDVYATRLFAPAFQAVGNLLLRFRRLQHGGVHLYVLYVALTLVILLVTTLN